ncbi:DUF2809 domain-containing protein [Chitinophaga oryziterrae]|uniref:DUF2809 domain-containing protein n=2 Tax=Chitinophaga oryziterrae TaxID=1031224 RepID=A0A6N8JIB7_9BACT|nr:DUF2809 domain-containing protein [Chitinophaga oryziterrae]MVT45013.1 DUF2809 domain-containing protein [Chitinophaga oryziterrae]
MNFYKNYFILAILLFITEILIALYLHDNFIRPYGGDFLVVILVYCMVKTCLNTPIIPTAIAVLLFAYVVEILQYFRIIAWLGLRHSRLACIILGTSFSWTDMLCYTLGIILVIIVEIGRTSKSLYLKT